MLCPFGYKLNLSQLIKEIRVPYDGSGDKLGEKKDKECKFNKPGHLLNLSPVHIGQESNTLERIKTDGQGENNGIQASGLDRRF